MPVDKHLAIQAGVEIKTSGGPLIAAPCNTRTVTVTEILRNWHYKSELNRIIKQQVVSSEKHWEQLGL